VQCALSSTRGVRANLLKGVHLPQPNVCKRPLPLHRTCAVVVVVALIIHFQHFAQPVCLHMDVCVAMMCELRSLLFGDFQVVSAQRGDFEAGRGGQRRGACHAAGERGGGGGGDEAREECAARGGGGAQEAGLQHGARRKQTGRRNGRVAVAAVQASSGASLGDGGDGGGAVQGAGRRGQRPPAHLPQRRRHLIV
jgi:hypothetical protein